MLRLVLWTIFCFFIVLCLILTFIDKYPKQFKKFENFIGIKFIIEEVILINKEIKDVINSVDNYLFYNN